LCIAFIWNSTYPWF